MKLQEGRRGPRDRRQGRRQGRRRSRRVLPRRRSRRDRRRRQRRQEAPERDRADDAGRHHRQGDADPRLERRARLHGVRRRPASATGSTPTARRSASAASAGRTSDGRDRDRRRRASRSATRPRSSRSSRTSSGSATSCRCRGSTKIVVNMGVGQATQQRSLLDGAVTDLTIITGQKPIVTQGEEVDRGLQAPRGQRDRRQGDAARRPDVGVLRPAREPGDPPHPRLPRHAPTSFDGRGNYTFGLTEQLVFPEIDYDKIDTVRGMDITIVTTAPTDDAGPRAAARARASRSAATEAQG